MSELATRRCEACRADSPPATPEEREEYGAQLAEWDVVERDGIPRLERTFEFDDFAGALAFTNTVGALAEAEGHHPAILTEWGRVTVTWWTHKIRDLHVNDFVMAAKTDEARRAAES